MPQLARSAAATRISSTSSGASIAMPRSLMCVQVARRSLKECGLLLELEGTWRLESTKAREGKGKKGKGKFGEGGELGKGK